LSHTHITEDKSLRYVQIPYINPNYVLFIALPKSELTSVDDIIYGLWQLVTHSGRSWNLDFHSAKLHLEGVQKYNIGKKFKSDLLFFPLNHFESYLSM